LSVCSLRRRIERNFPFAAIISVHSAYPFSLSSIHFIPFLRLLCKETGTTLRCIKALANGINQVLVEHSKRTFVASSCNQIRIYELEKFVKRSEYIAESSDMVPPQLIKLVRLIPGEGRVLVALHNDRVCVLSSELKLIRHFWPFKARQRYLHKSNRKIEMLSFIRPSDSNESSSNNNEANDKLRDYQVGSIVDVAFTPNGSGFAMSFVDNTVMFCSTSLWDVRRVIKFPAFYVRQCAFVPHTSIDYSPRFLIVQTSNDDLMMMSLNDPNSMALIGDDAAAHSLKFVLSANGRILSSVVHTGQVFVYNLNHHLTALATMLLLDDTKASAATIEQTSNDRRHREDNGDELKAIQMKVNLLIN